MKNYYSRWHEFMQNGRKINAIVCCLNRKRELKRLIVWAERKHLTNPVRCYQMKLDDEEQRLFRYRLSSPRLVSTARVLHSLNRMIFPTPRYLPKGSASVYRYGTA